MSAEEEKSVSKKARRKKKKKKKGTASYQQDLTTVCHSCHHSREVPEICQASSHHQS